MEGKGARFADFAAEKARIHQDKSLVSPHMCIRVKINLPKNILDGAGDGSFTPSWFMINLSSPGKISDLCQDITEKFNLPQVPSRLFVDGCLLPPWENTWILRENDVISLRYNFFFSCISRGRNPGYNDPARHHN